jgi:hypothetical protein
MGSSAAAKEKLQEWYKICFERKRVLCDNLYASKIVKTVSSHRLSRWCFRYLRTLGL